MKKNYFLAVLMAISWGAFSQNNALQFDGDDDYLEIVCTPPYMIDIVDQSFSIEIIFTLEELKHEQVLFYQNYETGEFTIGVDGNGHPYTKVNGKVHVVEEREISLLECTHLTFLYDYYEITAVINGDPIQSFQTDIANTVLDPRYHMYLGQSYPYEPSTLNGAIEDFRIFNEVIDLGQIQSFLFTELPIGVQGRFLYLNFAYLWPDFTRDPFNSLNMGYLGGTNILTSKKPTPTEDKCMIPLPESISTDCQPLPPCSNAGLPPSELICNGSFEQYCYMLDGPQPPWVVPEHAFMYTAQSAAQGVAQQSVPGSDVVNWWPMDPVNTPDFYVRNGIGSPNGFQPTFMGTLIPFGPTDTWNGQGNAVAALTGHPSFIGKEGISCELNSNLDPSSQYSFSGWFYNTHNGIASIPPSENSVLEVYYGDGAGNYTLAGTITIPPMTQVTGNNHWVFASVVINTPGSLPANIDRLAVRNTAQISTYLFLDDLSLKEIDPTSFPQYINTGEDTDSWHRRIKTDANDNVYVLGKTSNVSPALEFGLPTVQSISLAGNSVSSFITKYSSSGSLLWAQRYPQMEFNDIEIMPNGNIMAVGTAETIDVNITTPGPLPYTRQQTFNDPISTDCGGVSMNIQDFHTPQLLIAEINPTSGMVISAETYGGTGVEIGVDIEIIGNKAYIGCEIVPSYFSKWHPTQPGVRCHSGPQNNGLDWTQPFALNKRFAGTVLELDLGTWTKNHFAYAPNGPLHMMDAVGNDLYVLTGNELVKLDVTNLQQAPSSQAANIAPGPANILGLHVANNNTVFVTYTQHGMEIRDANNLSDILHTTTNERIMVTSRGNEVYTIGISGGEFFVDKLDENANPHYSTTEWVEATFGNLYFFNNYRSSGDLLFGDIVPLSCNKLAFVANFTTTGQSWDLNLSAKNLTGNNGPLISNTVVGSINDMDSIGVFKQMANKDFAETQDALNMYPNPATRSVHINAPVNMTLCRILTLDGRAIRDIATDSGNRLTFTVETLPKGMYLVEVYCNEKRYVEKLVVQ